MAKNSIESFIKTYVEALHDQNAAVFAGAGLSIPAGMVNWKDLLRDIAKDVGLNIDIEEDLITIAQYHFNEHGGRHKINQAILNDFSSRAALTDNHKLLASLPIKTYWTTNYDTLIEEALRAAGKKPDVKAIPDSLPTTIARRDAVVYKMHGDVLLPNQAVITKDDYETYDTKRHLFSMALQGDLVSKTFLFIGFSFSDPNLNYIFSRIRILLNENQRQHYCLLRKVQRSDFKKPKEFQYAQAKQELQVRDLKRYGITGLLVDSFSEYTAILQRIFNKFQMSRIFISGSAADYAPMDKAKAQELIKEISSQLVKKGFGVVSGFGLGVGEHVINGVLEELDNEGTKSLDDRIILRPFPFAITNDSERKRRWTAYRKDMLSLAGIALFLFGNKKDESSGNIIKADGVEEEFQIAVDKKLAVVPVGCTGGLAGELHKKVLGDFTSYYPRSGYKQLFQELGRQGSPKEIASRVVNLVKKLRDEA
jgi:hypothetical protein